MRYFQPNADPEDAMYQQHPDNSKAAVSLRRGEGTDFEPKMMSANHAAMLCFALLSGEAPKSRIRKMRRMRGAQNRTAISASCHVCALCEF